MNTNHILSGTIVKCQQVLCNNKTRLIENHITNLENFKCQICSGGFFISPVSDKLFSANSYTSCKKCKTIFLIKKDYIGKSLMCEFCKYENQLSEL